MRPPRLLDVLPPSPQPSRQHLLGFLPLFRLQTCLNLPEPQLPDASEQIQASVCKRGNLSLGELVLYLEQILNLTLL